VVWLGGKPDAEIFTKYKKNKPLEMMILTFHDKKESFDIQANKNEGEWLTSILQKIAASNTQVYTFQEIKADFETNMEHFELFWYSDPIYNLRDFGLLVL
jgi:ABC-type phosphate/phosphonate transport system substrate-binding protein